MFSLAISRLSHAYRSDPLQFIGGAAVMCALTLLVVVRLDWVPNMPEKAMSTTVQQVTSGPRSILVNPDIIAESESYITSPLMALETPAERHTTLAPVPVSDATAHISEVGFTVPVVVSSKAQEKTLVVEPVAVLSKQKPTYISIPAINLEAAINNPTGSDLATLEQSLTTGVVRYPSSGQLGEVGNMFIFGHSSHLPIIKNKMYKVFNNLYKLKVGDTIVISSNGVEATYAVSVVREADANTEGIHLTSDKRMLTLATCNTLSEKSARYIVEATFMSEKAI
jgi:LPXTG-site transpeptidase (sortase) family protein